jgi:hypothetical protein
LCVAPSPQPTSPDVGIFSKLALGWVDIPVSVFAPSIRRNALEKSDRHGIQVLFIRWQTFFIFCSSSY